MAKPAEHLNWAKNNEQLADTFDLRDSLEVDWAITILFYAGVHYVDAYLVSRDKRQPDHEGRDSAIQHDAFLVNIWSDYREIKRLSREARYELAPYTESEYRRAKDLLEKIKAEILPRLKSYL